jgi:hypothetical protein
MTERPKAAAWRARVLTLFPEMFPGPLGQSLAGKALEGGRWSLEAVDIRESRAINTARSTTRPSRRAWHGVADVGTGH